ncbi:cobalamin synthase [Candidatus Moduliflexus flocculans]|uniref:Adenosylcobinamide-GDP ribazoletransferase n=1 Tax=Candidatus Moduliflexus flocculans TaxID=1499966 RepID=A0A081BPQ1_9BACT|nr:cobalamin synthase [Candidatus Moduliflexus flocculans]
MIQREFHAFLAAVLFFTRLPGIVLDDEYAKDAFSQASRYFPLIGWMVGTMGAGAFWAASLILPFPLAILLSICATILVTGALHEDGFADVCDGFGAGWNKEQILAIMKDSYIGVYGVIGLILMLGFKLLCLVSLRPLLLPIVMISGHALSRFASISLMFSYEYARNNDESSKAKAVVRKLSVNELLFAAICGLFPFFLLALLTREWRLFGIGIAVVWLTRALCGQYFFHKIGGYTGDCLGAVQQITEVVFYAMVVATMQW